MRSDQETFICYTDNFLIRYKEIRDYRYKDISERQRNSKFCSDYEEEFGVDIKDFMKNWMRKKKPSRPDVPMLKNICDILDCDMEYLVGTQEAYRREYKTTSDYLGLSQKSIEHIKKLSEAQIHALDKMFENQHMNKLLYSMVRTASFANHNGTIKIQLDSDMHTPYDENSQMPEFHKEIETNLNMQDTKEMLIFQVHQDALDMVKHVLNSDVFKEQARQEFHKSVNERREERNKANSQPCRIMPTIEFDEDGNIIEQERK